MTDCDPDNLGMPVVHLSLNAVGIIIMFPSGVIYHNQTCNAACYQRCQEGILVMPTAPVLITREPAELYQCEVERGLRAMEWGPVRGIDEVRAANIDALLLNSHVRGISVDRSMLSESEEAWIYVDVQDGEYYTFKDFGPRKGVLVWENSD